MAHVSEMQATWIVCSEMSVHNATLYWIWVRYADHEASCCCLLILKVQFLTTVTLCEQHDVPLKRRLTFSELHVVISQKVERSSIDRITCLSLRGDYGRLRL
jgi:hypothetical protein